MKENIRPVEDETDQALYLYEIGVTLADLREAMERMYFPMTRTIDQLRSETARENELLRQFQSLPVGSRDRDEAHRLLQEERRRNELVDLLETVAERARQLRHAVDAAKRAGASEQIAGAMTRYRLMEQP
jgi:hypothetical protein